MTNEERKGGKRLRRSIEKEGRNREIGVQSSLASLETKRESAWGFQIVVEGIREERT